MNLKSWLRRVPQPVTIRAGKAVIRVGEGKNKWRDCLEQIEHLQPARIEALDAEGAIIRGVDLEHDSDEPGARADTKDEAGDDQLVKLARIISDAHEQGAARMAGAFGDAFKEYTGLVALLSNRLTAVEGNWQQLLAQRAAETAGEGGPAAAGDDLTKLVATMIGGKMAAVGLGGLGAPAEKPNGKPSGKPNGKTPKRVIDTEGSE